MEKSKSETAGTGLSYFCDTARHLVCSPYSVENLHKMAKDLNIKRHWFHSKKGMEHYDIPKTRMKEIMEKCEVVDSRHIVDIIKYDQIERVSKTGATPKDHFTQQEFKYNGY